MNFVDTDTSGTQLRVLRGQIYREIFDPTNPAHRESVRKFLTTGNWGDVQFFAEGGVNNVPETVLRKLALYHLAN